MTRIARRYAMEVPGFNELRRFIGQLAWFQAWTKHAQLHRLLTQMQPYLDETYPLDERVGLHGYCIPTEIIDELFQL